MCHKLFMVCSILGCVLFIPGGALFIPRGCLIHPHPALIIPRVGLNWSPGMNRSLYLNASTWDFGRWHPVVWLGKGI